MHKINQKKIFHSNLIIIINSFKYNFLKNRHFKIIIKHCFFPLLIISLETINVFFGFSLGGNLKKYNKKKTTFVLNIIYRIKKMVKTVCVSKNFCFGNIFKIPIISIATLATAEIIPKSKCKL